MGEALIVRRGSSGGGGGGSHTVTLVSLLPSGTETITYTGTASGTVNIVNGTGSVLLPTGTYTFTSSDTIWTSGTVAVTGNISINCWYGTPVYWYGNICDSGGWNKSGSNVVLSFGTDHIAVHSGGSGSGTKRHAFTENSYDFTSYNSVNACCEYTGSSLTYASFIAYGTSKNSSTSTYALQQEKLTATQTQQILTISLNQHPTAAYLYFGNSAAGADGYLYAMWLN